MVHNRYCFLNRGYLRRFFEKKNVGFLVRKAVGIFCRFCSHPQTNRTFSWCSSPNQEKSLLSAMSAVSRGTLKIGCEYLDLKLDALCFKPRLQMSNFELRSWSGIWDLNINTRGKVLASARSLWNHRMILDWPRIGLRNRFWSLVGEMFSVFKYCTYFSPLRGVHAANTY